MKASLSNPKSRPPQPLKRLITFIKFPYRKILYHISFYLSFKSKKVENITQPFIYLGQVSTFPGSAEGNKPITMKFALHSRVPDKLFNDFITRTDKMGKNSDN